MASQAVEIAVAVAVALGLVPAAPPGAARQAPASVSLSASEREISFGERVRLAGRIETDAPCHGNRAVTLEARPGASARWAAVATSASEPDGGFTFSITPEHTSTYRALVREAVLGADTCAAAASAEVGSAVRATVVAHVSRTVLPAGGCIRVGVAVRPPKAGHAVVLEERVEGAWRSVPTPLLDADSSLSVERCYGWDAIGGAGIRAAWPAQDDLNVAGTTAVQTVRVERAGWMRRIDRLTAGRSIGISVREAGSFLYRRADDVRRLPASNQKLLLSMALLDRLGAAHRLRTVAAATAVEGGAVRGDLWILGGGDPTTDRRAMRALASRVSAAGVRRVDGRVMGSTSYFARDWFAPGWKRSFPREQVALPSALTFEGNEARGRHVRDPERRAARWLAGALRARGVQVASAPGSGRPPQGLVEIAAVESPRLALMLRRVNRRSSNFAAEVLGKRLGSEVGGVPGTIEKGARAVADWAAGAGAEIAAYDSSGLSYRNRASPIGIARLLGTAEALPWGPALRASLAAPGQGTLKGRLRGVRVRAKTGTLTRTSALSGWVWLRRRGTWAEFSIISRGLPKSTAVSIENAVVRAVGRFAG